MASRGWAVRGQRLAGVVLVIGATALFGVGVSAASQGGDDHKVTICHRTNAENNPYVEITVDMASIFKQGHDTHDEGVVHQPGDKAAGKRWGDIIPAFDYYASPQAETAGTLSHYDGLNDTAEGLALLDADCDVPDEEEPEPEGALFGECENASFVVSGVVDADGGEAVSFRLSLTDGSTIALSGTTFEKTVTASPGTKVSLQVQIGDGAWTDIDDPVTVADCAPPSSSAPVTSSSSAAVVSTTAAVASQAASVLPTKVENTTAKASPEASVLAVAEQLPHTGGGIPYTALMVLALGLLLSGGALILLPGLSVERSGHRRH